MDIQDLAECSAIQYEGGITPEQDVEDAAAAMAEVDAENIAAVMAGHWSLVRAHLMHAGRYASEGNISKALRHAHLAVGKSIGPIPQGLLIGDDNPVRSK